MATEVAAKYNVRLIWIDTRDDSINFLNIGHQAKVLGQELFPL